MSDAHFIAVDDGIFLLRVPCNGVTTGIVLVEDDAGCAVIDSAHGSAAIDDYLVPALAERGLQFSDLSLLLCTHTHGDHIGGHRRIRERCPLARILASAEQKPKLRDPFTYAKATRDAFPGYSPAPNPALRGAEADGLIAEGDLLLGRLEVIKTPGHDNDCVCFFDHKTGTLIAGDSVQAAGTPAQGLALYVDVDGYCESLAKITALHCENMVTAHAYTPFEDILIGEETVNRFLDVSAETVALYDRLIREKQKEELLPPDIARAVLAETHADVPPYLFLPLHTVSAHLRNI